MQNTSPAAPLTIPTIETTWLVLRSFAAADLDDYTRLIFADAEVMRYLPKRDLAPRDRAGRTIAVFTEHWSQHGVSAWAVADKVTGVLFEDLDERSEPLVDRSGSLTVLGNVNCAMKWKLQANTPTPGIALSGDYTYWSMC